MTGDDHHLLLAWGQGQGPARPTPVPPGQPLQIAPGGEHAVLLAASGKVYTRGDSDSGQLGLGGYAPRHTFTQVGALRALQVTHVAAGLAHSAAVTALGKLMTWGAAEFGQLGLGNPHLVGADVDHPRGVKFVAMGKDAKRQNLVPAHEVRFVSVACGDCHTLALSSNAFLFTCGQGTFGALGLGDYGNQSSPTCVLSLATAGIVQVAAGANHSAALGIDGKVFTWGRGKYGQLGTGTYSSSAFPIHVSSLQEPVLKIVCGNDHTLLLGKSGAVYAFGRGNVGQTGLQTRDHTTTPQRVDTLAPYQVVQIAAGANHSVALTDANQVFCFGNGGGGQLGLGDCVSVAHPVQVVLDPGPRVWRIGAGGDATFCVMQAPGQAEDGLESGVQHSEGVMKLDSLMDMFETLGQQGHGEVLDANILRVSSAIEDVFSSPGLVVAGFTPLRARGSRGGRQVDAETNLPYNLNHLDVAGIDEVYRALMALGDRHWEIMASLTRACRSLLSCVLQIVQDTGAGGKVAERGGSLNDTWLKALLILIQNPVLSHAEHTIHSSDDLLINLVNVMALLPEKAQIRLVEWISGYPKELFGRRFVQPVQRLITAAVVGTSMADEAMLWSEPVKAALQYLVILHAANETAGRPIPFTDFHNSDLSLKVNLREHYLRWIQMTESEARRGPLASVCQIPFILTAEAKSRILQGESNLQKRHEMRNSRLQAAFEGVEDWNEFFELQIRRDALLPDALQQILQNPRDLKKPLRVQFTSAGVPEEGLDEGGVTKEFFQLLVREVFDPELGMFHVLEDTRTYWFNQSSSKSELLSRLASPSESCLEFQLVGAYFGLAIYNGVILDVQFPSVIYKRLKGFETTFQDLRDAMPDLGRGLQKVLDFPGDVRTMGLNFVASYDHFGKSCDQELIPDGARTPVTNENREKYVELYSKFLLEDAVQPQFLAFYQGFHQVCGGPALALFRWEELEMLICGVPDLDFHALRQVAQYDGGYSAEHRVIEWFWTALLDFDHEAKKRFLFFVTGCGRAPPGGLSQLVLTIQRMSSDTEQLPTAHTCFNVLLLPEYGALETLRQRLWKALDYAGGGFGLA